MSTDLKPNSLLILGSNVLKYDAVVSVANKNQISRLTSRDTCGTTLAAYSQIFVFPYERATNCIHLSTWITAFVNWNVR